MERVILKQRKLQILFGGSDGLYIPNRGGTISLRLHADGFVRCAYFPFNSPHVWFQFNLTMVRLVMVQRNSARD